MWARGAVESEMFLYGTHYGVGWWSNCHYPKLTMGVDLGKYHKLSARQTGDVLHDLLANAQIRPGIEVNVSHGRTRRQGHTHRKKIVFH